MAPMHDLQRAVADFVAQQGLEADLAHRLLDLVAELGELAKEALKASAYGAQPFEAGPGWADELGDVLFSLLCVANLSGVDIEQALRRALDKYAARIAASGAAGSGR